MDINIYKLIGGVGLLLISLGLVLKNRKREDALYIIGGICLEIYSIHIQDVIFIVLQIIFIFFAVYDRFKVRKSEI